MGYHLSIGEARLDVDYDDRSARFGVSLVDGKELGAPQDPTGFGTQGNQNSPSYTAWHGFAESTGLSSVFYGDGSRYRWWKDAKGNEHDGILRQHPGCEPLTQDIYLAFKQAQEVYVPNGDDDWNVVRLNWLVWWTRWALDNCKYPSFANS